jgi:hypothetical protein
MPAMFRIAFQSASPMEDDETRAIALFARDRAGI